MNFWLAVHSSFEKAFSALEQTKNFFISYVQIWGPQTLFIIGRRERWW